MGQTPTMQAAWEKLGQTPETAQPIIASRFDYAFDPIMLAITALVIVFYFYFVVRYSDKEYRDVIRERFGDK
jgi:heme/copper-type cytochrome/quinol oxidase subunit 2